MFKQLLINVEQDEKRVATVEGTSLEEFYVERADQQRVAGNVYKGIVSAILPGMAAAFIKLGLEKDGFLHVSDVVERPDDLAELISEPLEREDTHKRPKRGSVPQITKLLKKGQEIMVQVVKEPIGTKGARLTTHISLPGRFLVLMPYENHIGISKRIANQKERVRIKKILAALKLPKDIGLIVRTAAAGANDKAFANEVKYLLKIWEKIKRERATGQAPKPLHQEYDVVLRVVRDIFTKDVNRLIVDDKEEHKKISHFVKTMMPQLRLRIRYHRPEVPLFEKFNIEGKIARIFEKRIYLKNRGHIVIEQTEGLVAIDVNTGGFVGKKNLEETAFITNTEAAKEIARQLRLRDIGGIIIIDFIDMEMKGHRQKVFETLKDCLKRDKARTKVLNISSFGIVEMTRQRMRRSVESLSYKICPYCNGRGGVKSVATVCIEAKRKMAQVLKNWPKKELVIYVHPDVCRYLVTKDTKALSTMENKFRRKIVVREDESFHIEQIKIESLDKE